MYKSIPERQPNVYSEGIVVEFKAAAVTSWVANFEPGATQFSHIHSLDCGNRFCIVANGNGYLIDPAQKICIAEFGGTITQKLHSDNECTVYADWQKIYEVTAAKVGASVDIAIDGLEELEYSDRTVRGLAGEPTPSNFLWKPFTYDFKSKHLFYQSKK